MARRKNDGPSPVNGQAPVATTPPASVPQETPNRVGEAPSPAPAEGKAPSRRPRVRRETTPEPGAVAPSQALEVGEDQVRELSDDVRQVREQVGNLQRELANAGRELQAFVHEFESVREKYALVRAHFDRERVELAELNQRMEVARQELLASENRLRDFDRAMTTAADDLVVQMAERVRVVELESQAALRQLQVCSEGFLRGLKEGVETPQGKDSAGEAPGSNPGLPGTSPEGGSGKKQLGVTVDPAAKVLEVLPDTPAEKAGLRPGDKVVEVEGQPIQSAEDLVHAVEKAGEGRPLTLTVARPGPAENAEAPGQVADEPENL